MKQYTVKNGQNIYDIALLLYGSIEGVFDIIINNDSVDINSSIKAGTVLDYNENFKINPQIIDWLSENKINVANGDPGFDVSGIDLDSLRIVVDQSGATSVIVVRLSSGSMFIDWGDGTNIDAVSDTLEHDFDHPYNDDGRHEIRIYGNFVLHDFDISEIGGIYYALNRCKVSGTFTESTNRTDLQTLFK